MSTNEWKIKYFDLKQKFLDATDTAYRLGYEQGAKDTQIEMQAQQMAQQQAQQAAMQDGAVGVDENGNPVDEMGNPVDPNQMSPEMQDQAMQEGGEELPPDVDPEVSQQLDNHINELESLVSKGEKPKVTDLRKVVDGLVSLRKSQKQKWKKNVEKRSSAQKSLVDGILAKWEKESKDVTKDLEDQILKEGLKIED